MSYSAALDRMVQQRRQATGGPYEPEWPMRPNQRAVQMRQMHSQGLTFKAIGQEFGISGVRVRQLVASVEREEREARSSLRRCFRRLVDLMPTLSPDWDPETGQWRAGVR